MSEQVTVKSVGEGRPWEHGITYWDVMFDRNGADFYCIWGKKDTAPVIGEQAEGEFFQKNGEWRFRKASKPVGGSLEATVPRPSGEKPPDVQRQIIRQHSQEMALRMFAITKPPGLSADLIKEILPAWADFFDADVLGQTSSQAQGAEKSEGAPPLSSPSPEPGKRPANDTGQWIEKLLGDAGLEVGPARTLAEFVVGRMREDQVKKAEVGLGDPETMAKTLADLEQAYRLTTGEILVTEDPEDDIPF